MVKDHIASNGQFGRDRSRCFANEQLALDYYDKLTAELYQGVPKVVSGVGRNTEMIPEYQLI
jgi:hypothetical protein